MGEACLLAALLSSSHDCKPAQRGDYGKLAASVGYLLALLCVVLCMCIGAVHALGFGVEKRVTLSPDEMHFSQQQSCRNILLKAIYSYGSEGEATNQ